MARRTKLYQVMPWVGGVNTSVDSGVLGEQELVQADNVKFSSTGARIKRDALEYLDDEVPAPITRSSSGTTRSLLFDVGDLIETSPANYKLVVGERITVTGNVNYAVEDAVITSIVETVPGAYTITIEAGSDRTYLSVVRVGL